ncbi:MAG: TetR/AcrR family transcriptional regulator [Clostridia bacterium]|nr:TetR/AcrR family transcriptional regulator [Clostridia bacterium]MDD7483119.1 TetR/AcrR family transcriptional regulator [Clostridia bacterium]MDY5558866.1 TetR/AcrR family transcriptional regulator [Candidatus Heritagella sp.]
MPPRVKRTKEEIVDAAFDLVRENGMAALSARSLARALGTSTGPIFTAFTSIEEIQNEVLHRAKDWYARYIQEGLKQIPAFKGAGMAYIRFAKDEPELFRLLFMAGDGTENATHFLPSNDDNAPFVLEAVEDGYGLMPENAKNLYNHMSIYAFGLAALFAQRIYRFTMDDISRMMTEMFTALKEKEEKDHAEN